MAAVLNAASASASYAQSATDPTLEQPNTVTCESREGQRQYCPANTSAGVALVRSTGTAPCLLGKTWGYDDGGIWTSDGCSGEFIAGQVAQEPDEDEGARARPQRRVSPVRRREGPDLFPALQLRALSQSAEHRRVLHRLLRRRAHGPAAAGHSAGEVLLAVLRMVPDAEVPLLPLCLVVERVAGRSGAGRRRRQSELHVQSFHHGGRAASPRCRPCAAPKDSSRTGSASTAG